MEGIEKRWVVAMILAALALGTAAVHYGPAIYRAVACEGDNCN